MSKEYDHFWKYHNKTNMDIHAVELIELQEKRNDKLKRAIKDQLPTSLSPCPKCEMYGVTSKQEMCDKCQIEIFKEFIRYVIKVNCWGIKAVELGLLEEHIATEEDVDPEFDEYEVGDTIYRFSDMLKGE